MVVVSDTALVNNRGCKLCVYDVFVAIQGSTACTFCVDKYFIVLEVGLFDDNLCSIAQSVFGIIEFVVLLC